MKLGLLTDIHEHVEHLRAALQLFRAEAVDQIVVIGDLTQLGERLVETCRLLSEAKAIGVWGNHDYGLCAEPKASLCAEHGEAVSDFMPSLRPKLEIAGCHFAHVEPWLDPEELADLWYFEGPPKKRKRLDRIFSAVQSRFIFAGHYHRWLLATPHEIRDWPADSRVSLADERHFVVVGALCDGHCAVFDTEAAELVPMRTQP